MNQSQIRAQAEFDYVFRGALLLLIDHNSKSNGMRPATDSGLFFCLMICIAMQIAVLFGLHNPSKWLQGNETAPL
jgi:hypothetical protein